MPDCRACDGHVLIVAVILCLSSIHIPQLLITCTNVMVFRLHNTLFVILLLVTIRHSFRVVGRRVYGLWKLRDPGVMILRLCARSSITHPYSTIMHVLTYDEWHA